VGCPERVGKRAFLRGARGRYYVTTRINSDKWEKEAEIRGLIAYPSQFLEFLQGYVGRLTVLEQAHKNCFWKTNPQKRLIFLFNHRFWDCFVDGFLDILFICVHLVPKERKEDK
jgi:hypothetical protein